jgi:signal transduction histidine kinase
LFPPIYRGEGDLHDPTFPNTHSISLTTEGLFSDTSATYILELYPTQEFYNEFRTFNPWIATIGAVSAILLTSLLFFTYDFFVRKEFDAKKELLEAKRKYVRFVSHEVRTPLNTVYMGLQLLQEEVGETPRVTENGTNQGALAKQDGQPPGDITYNKEWVELINDILINTNVAVDVLNDLLNYDNIQRGNMNLELGIVPIWNLVEQTVTEFKLMAVEKNVNLNLDFSNIAEGDAECSTTAVSLPQDVRNYAVVGDEMRISQILRNLISNGLKFTSDQGKLRALRFFYQC